MKRSILFAIATALVVGSQATPGGDQTTLHFKLRVLEGDPLGSREAGTLKVLSEPSVTTLPNRPAFFFSGGEIPAVDDGRVEHVRFGRIVDVKPGVVKDGKIRLDITMSNTTVVGESTEERIQLHTESTRTIATVRLGEVVKLRCGKGSAEKQAWVELSVVEVKSAR